MLLIQSLTIQLENLKVVLEDVAKKDSNSDDFQKIFLQIKEIEMQIAVEKAKLDDLPQ